MRCAACGHKWFQPPANAPEAPPRAESAQSSDPARAEPTAPTAAAAAPTARPPAADRVEPPRSAPVADPVAEPVTAGQSWRDRDIDELPPPPFGPGAGGRRRPRRNPARRLTILAAAFALIVVGAAGAIAWFGVPAWADDWIPAGASSDPDLVIELPVDAQDHRTLPNNVIYFEANGSIINPTDRSQRVPPIKAELRDATGRIVYEWIINPPVAVLPPGERVRFSEAKLDIPNSAVRLTASWAPVR